jgi:filamentous hemagglutinin
VLNNPLRFSDPSGENWWDDNWKTVVTVGASVAAVVIIVASAGTATPFVVAIAAGAGGGLVGGIVGTKLNGGGWAEALGAGVKGAFFGAVGGAIGFGIGALVAVPTGAIAGGLYGAASGVVVNGVLNTIQNRPFFEGAALSAVLGGAGGAIGGYASAKKQGLNPITGAPKPSVIADNPNVTPTETQAATNNTTQTQNSPTTEQNTVQNSVQDGGENVNGNCSNCGIVNSGNRRIISVDGVNTDIQPTIDRIAAGVGYPHRNDGTIFRNTEGLLPTQARGYYTEYVHPTPGISHAGPMRLVYGQAGEIYFTPDHYRSFYPIR